MLYGLRPLPLGDELWLWSTKPPVGVLTESERDTVGAGSSPWLSRRPQLSVWRSDRRSR